VAQWKVQCLALWAVLWQEQCQVQLQAEQWAAWAAWAAWADQAAAWAEQWAAQQAAAWAEQWAVWPKI
jgi:hypothetical protein